MPTAAKLVAALWFAALGWLAANAHVPALGENASVGWFRELTGLLGLLVGWRVMGNLAGGGYVDAIGSGLRSSVTLAVLALLLFSAYLMVMKSMGSNAYGADPMVAVLDVFRILLDQARRMATVGVLGVLGLGGVAGGVVTEWAKRHWR